MRDPKAFWMNAYNALSLWVIREHYPVKSMRRSNFGLVWEVPIKNEVSVKVLKYDWGLNAQEYPPLILGFPC